MTLMHPEVFVGLGVCLKFWQDENKTVAVYKTSQKGINLEYLLTRSTNSVMFLFYVAWPKQVFLNQYRSSASLFPLFEKYICPLNRLP